MLIWVLPIVAVGAVAAALAMATGEPPAAPTAPAQPAPVAPEIRPVPPAAAPETVGKPVAPPEAEKSLIRHGRAEPIAKPAGAVRIATYNIENLFDNELTPGSPTMNTIKPAAHRKAVAEAIHKINADIIALEEIESKETVTKFRDEYLSDMGYTHIVSIDAGDARGIEQSVLSRFPLKDEANWPKVALGMNHPEKLGKRSNPDAGKPLILHRSPLRVTAAVPAMASGNDKPVEITLFAVHHKSGPYYGYEREAEARKTLSLVHEFEGAHAGAMVVVLGDFNARMMESPIEVYTKGGMTDAFRGVSGGVEAKEYLSHVSGRTIDHILLNAPAMARVNPETRFVLGMPQRPEGADWRKSDPPVGYGSDHYPVVVDLLLTGAVLKSGSGAATSPVADPK